MVKCDACGKRADGLGTCPTAFQDVILCTRCYEGLKAFKHGRKAKNLKEFQGMHESALQEMKEKQYPEHVIEQVDIWFEKKISEHTIKKQVDEGMKNANYLMMTSGFNFEGYDIIEYHGIVCGESVLGTGFMSSFDASISDTLGIESLSFIEKLQEARDAAKRRAIQKVLESGGNALIGADIDYSMFSSNMIAVMFNGTSVTIKKKESSVLKDETFNMI